MFELLTALTLSIYDAPSDRTKVVIELCGPSACERLITPKSTLEQDYDNIETWALRVGPSLEEQ